MDEKIVIGICGKARAGKNEIAKYLTKYHAFKEDSFASPIRQSCIHLLGLSGLDELDRIKEQSHELLNNKTPREYMQKMGTEFGRNMICDDIWIKSLYGRNKNTKRLCVSDIRFENEMLSIKNNGGFIIRIVRPGVEIKLSNHQSESGISDEFIDYEIINDGTLLDLIPKIESVMKKIFTIKDNL